MHVVESVDPNFLRTVVVASKFDNRHGLRDLERCGTVDPNSLC